MMLSIFFMNIVAVFFLIVLILNVLLVGKLTLPLVGLAVFCLAWLFFRRKLTSKVLFRKMKRQPSVNKFINVAISNNGIIWEGEGLKTGHLNWQHLKYIIKVDNGFIMPTSISRFIWLPKDGFANESNINEFLQACKHYEVKLKKAKWRC